MRTNTTTCNCQTSLIEITGLCDPENVTPVISEYPYWMQMSLPESLTIPSYKPEAEHLDSIDVSVEIIRTLVIKTPSSYTTDTIPVPIPNLEGKTLTGRKLIIEGQLCQKIIYTALVDNQQVHSVDFYVPFSSYIVVPEEITFTSSTGVITIVDSLDVNYEVNACIEDVSACLTDSRNINKQVTLLLYAVPTQA